MKIINGFIVVFFLFILSCSNISFVYDKDNNLTNPLYNKTNFVFLGSEISSMYRLAPKYFGSTKNPEHTLFISVVEDKTKKSVQKNQAISQVDYEIIVSYKLENNLKKCTVIEKVAYSNFSHNPKSSGYNFGSDESLSKMYELASIEIFEEMVDFLSNYNLDSCQSEN